MKRGLHHRPASARGRRRVAAFGAGILAAFSLVWQQQTTLASFVDAEHGKATFSADTLTAITPSLDPSYGTIQANWSPAEGDWAAPQYALDWSTTSGGLDASPLYSGPATNATLTVGAASQSEVAQGFTDVAAGSTHACGVSHGSVYCWGTSTNGGLGLGAGVTSAPLPTRVAGALDTETVVQVTAGTNFTCARTSSGGAFCWGLASSYQLGNGSTTRQFAPVAVPGLSHVTDISAGTVHACAVDSGTAYCWGSNAYGQIGNGSTTTATSPKAVGAGQPFAGRTVSQVSAGYRHTCAVADGRAFCWGYNANGRLGDGTTTQRTSPVGVSTATELAGRRVSAISVGYGHSCAIADGGAYCWGLNSNRQLGDGTTTQRTTPVRVSTTNMGGVVTTLSAGYYHSCAIADGGGYCWGLGTSGQLGAATSTSSAVPVRVQGAVASTTLREITAGTNFSCATGDSPAACWGLASSGQLGNGSTTNKTSAVNVSLTDAACPSGSVRVGTDCSLSEATDYFLRLGYSIGTWTSPNSAWVKATTKTRGVSDPAVSSRTGTSITANWDAATEVGDSYVQYTLERSVSSNGSNPQTIAITPALLAEDAGGLSMSRNWSQVSVGSDHACAIVDGELFCWGRNSSGQLGVGDTTSRDVPTRVDLPGTVTKVSAGVAHTCAISSGVAYCWGVNTYGQLGDQTTSTRTSPVAVAGQGGYTVLDISAGADHSCAVTQGGQSWCWGRNNYGQLGNSSTTDSSSPVGPHAGAIPAGTVTRISAGLSHTCAVAGSRAYCWGRGNAGQLGFNATQSNAPVAVNTGYSMGTKAVTEISSGSSHTCAIAEAKAYCWGSDSSGQIGNGTAAVAATWATTAVSTSAMSGSVTAISAGVSHSCAVAGGRAYCWGLGTSGQLGNAASTSQTAPVAVAAGGALSGSTGTDIAAGSTHSCDINQGALFCWGSNSDNRLGSREESTATTNYPRAVVAEAMCAAGAKLLGDGTCTLAPSTTYYYRLSYTWDGVTAKTGDWVGLTTS